MNTTDLSSYNNDWYKVGASHVKQVLWYITNALIFNSYLFPFSSVKILIAKLFGAKIGKGCVIKPKVNIKYPWKLVLEDYIWIGEKVWIDNLANVKLGSNVCLSQGVMLLCGNHNYKKQSFDLMIGEITIEDGAWLGAKSVVCPGVRVKSHAVLTVGSVLSQSTTSNMIYQGNPAQPIKERILSES